jgi:hypothetical protein
VDGQTLFSPEVIAAAQEIVPQFLAAEPFWAEDVRWHAGEWQMKPLAWERFFAWAGERTGVDSRLVCRLIDNALQAGE